MKKISKFLRYLYWLGAKVHYKYFEEGADNAKFLFTMIISFFLIDVLTFFRVLFFDHKSYFEIFGFNATNFIKIGLVFFAILIWLIISHIFKEFPIKNNIEFNGTSKKTRIFHTVLLYSFWFFLFYVFLVIMSPSFHPSQLKFW